MDEMTYAEKRRLEDEVGRIVSGLLKPLEEKILRLEFRIQTLEESLR